MFTGESDRAWSAYGTADPYFGVLTDERFHKEKLDEAALRAFFRTGEEHIGAVLDVVRARQGADYRPRRALDFGCGVGRLVIPLAGACDAVVGVDVSDGMLAEARKNCAARGLANVELAKSDDTLSRVQGTFDFVHSYIVFQHIPVERGMAIFRTLVGRLEPGGVGALHFSYHRSVSPVRRAVNWMRRKVPLVNNLVNLAQGRSFFCPLMQMNRYSLNDLLQTFQEQGCHVWDVRFTDEGGHFGVLFFFSKDGGGRWPGGDGGRAGP